VTLGVVSGSGDGTLRILSFAKGYEVQRKSETNPVYFRTSLTFELIYLLVHL
jgi:hypothetical protein